MKKVKPDFSKYTEIHGPYGKLSWNRAKEWNTKKRQLPLDVLETSYKVSKVDEGAQYLVHWFRNDLRIQDNTALWHMIEDAKITGANPIGLYVISTKFWDHHCEGAYKIDLILNTLRELKSDLIELNIPLSVVYLDDLELPAEYGSWFKELILGRFKSKDVYFNILYEYDEMMRDIEVLRTDLNCHIYHDQCIVKPLTLTTGKGSQYSKFTPWYKKWETYLQENPTKLLEVTHQFADWDHEFVKDDDYTLDHRFLLDSLGEYGVKDYLHRKAGEQEALKQLERWMDHIKAYDEEKDFPAKNATSRLSGHITVGAISTRTIVFKCQQLNQNKRVGGNRGIATFIKEVAWRDFYRHIVSHWPYVMMFRPFNFASLDMEWDQDLRKFQKWCLGRTGFPLVDAAMRELLQTGFMNNRLRMVCASFLAKDLLQDWRMGEKWFHHHLVDADLASNNGGWGWCSSTGIDAQPWFRIFNVYTQSEKFDPKGEYIKRWVPELKHLGPKEIHNPPPQENYPEPIADRREAREVALEKYRDALT
jgi:deoxyribodipyrimidine photo-lyase